MPTAPHAEIVVGIPVDSSHCEPLPFIQTGLPVQNATAPASPLPLCEPGQPVENVEEQIPSTSMARAVMLFDKVRPRVDSICASLRPWREFAILAKPEGDIMNRLQVNLRYYKSNYAVGFLSLSVGTVALSPSSLIAVAFLLMIWMKFLDRDEDPEWRVRVRGYELGRPQQWLVLQTLSGVVLLFAVGPHFLHAALVACFFALSHAVMHPSPESLVDAADSFENSAGGAHALVLNPEDDIC